MKKKTKIFLFNPYPAVGGVDTTIKRFLPFLKKKFDIEYISLTKKNCILEKNVKNTTINTTSTFRSFFKIYKIYKNDKHPKKIFFSFQYFANVWSIIFIKLLLRGKLLIYEVNHLDELIYYNSIKDFIKKKIIKLAVKFLYKYPDIVSTNSRESTNDLKKFVKRDVYTIPNPCFSRKITKKNKYKSLKNINILNISRFEHQKDHLTLLKAINHSAIKNKINLFLVGYGKNYNKIKSYVDKNRIKVKIFLKNTNLKKFYLNADLYICTSLYEGLPTTVIEAASYSIPIISSNFKSGAKEILKNGKQGTIFKKGDYKKLAKILDNFYYNPQPFFKKEYLCRKNISFYSVKNSKLELKKIINKLN